MKSKGVKTSTKMVRELMRDMGLVSIRQVSKSLYADEARKHKIRIYKEHTIVIRTLGVRISMVCSGFEKMGYLLFGGAYTPNDAVCRHCGGVHRPRQRTSLALVHSGHRA